MKPFKVIKEYPKYYLCERVDKGYKECFDKATYEPDDEGLIYVVDEFELNRQWMLRYWEERYAKEREEEDKI